MSNNTVFQKLEKIKKVDLIKFVKYNFLTPQVKRAKGAYIIPFKGAKDVTIEDHVWLFVISINAFSFIASKTPKGNSIRVSYHASFIILLPNVIPM